MKYVSTALLALFLAGSPAMFGCDRTVSHTDSTEQKPDGTVTHDSTTVQQDANGNTIKTQTKSEDKPQQ